LSNHKELRILDAPPLERADAARNRAKILAAAATLFDERGAANVSMDDVSAAAGVGKGTLYRRFGDQAGLAFAVLETQEKALQERILSGPPPLGPGAPPPERLSAFLQALLDLVYRTEELHLLSETATPGARYRTGVYSFYRLHVELQLREAGGQQDPELVADMLLAPLSADFLRYVRVDRKVAKRRVLAGLMRLIESVCSEPSTGTKHHSHGAARAAREGPFPQGGRRLTGGADDGPGAPSRPTP